VQLSCEARDLLLVTWEVSSGTIARTLPAGVKPAVTPNGGALVSLAAVRITAVRAGAMPLPSWSQLAVRTYVQVAGEHAILFLSLRVTPPGLAAAMFGVPVRPALVRVARGLVRSSGLGVSIRYRVLPGPAGVPELEGGPVGHHDVAYVVAAGMRRLIARHDPFAFEAAELLERPRLDSLLALGFDVEEPVSVLYAAGTAFALELPPERVRS
jgi:hypothetical protein